MASAPVNLICKLMKGGLFPLLNRSQCTVPPRKPSNAHTVIGHSMSKGIKKMSKIFTGCCLLLLLIILIKLWNSHAKRVAGLWRWRALGDLGGKKPLRYQLCGYCFFLNLKKIYIYISLELLGMFIDDDVLCATELWMQERGKNHQPRCQGLDASVPQTLLKISGYRLSSCRITLY